MKRILITILAVAALLGMGGCASLNDAKAAQGTGTVPASQ